MSLKKRLIIWSGILAFIPFMLSLVIFCLPAQYGDTYLGALQHKYEALRHTEGKKIVVIGGSGVAFSQESHLIEAELGGYKVINFGLYGGLGIPVMLDLARPYIEEGDIVILSPEQNKQALSMYFSGQAMWQALDGHYRMLLDLTTDQKRDLLGQAAYFARDKWTYFWDHKAIEVSGIYQEKAFNAYGDISSDLRSANIMVGGYDRTTPLVYDEGVMDEDFLAYINDFADSCQTKGASVYYRFLPSNIKAVEETSDPQAYSTYLEGVLDFPVLGNVEEALMAEAWFYDTNYHLNSAGAKVNTIGLIEDLKGVLGMKSDGHLPLPDQPVPISRGLIEGDQTDEDCFLYEVMPEGVVITGLRDKGQAQEDLVLPVSHNGLAVVRFLPQVFQGNKVIKRIYLQANIGTIEDASFEGCSQLQYLYMAHEIPSDCLVSQGLLLGSDCQIVVSKEAYGRYATDYFWGLYADRLMADSSLDREEVAEIHAVNQVESIQFIYEGNGGYSIVDHSEVLVTEVAKSHLRINTGQGSLMFERPGYVAIGWNTEADGSGRSIGFGSRVDDNQGVISLYTQWAKANEEGDFDYILEGDEVWITGYKGSGRTCVIPETIQQLPVTRICQEAFDQAQVDTVVLPDTIFKIEAGSFQEASLQTLYLYDSLYYVYNDSFQGCDQLTTLHVNAATSPVYSGTYYDAYTDKMDWLMSIQDKSKMVLFSGSSGRYGYNSLLLKQAFPDYEVANMGVYAYTNALPQLVTIKHFMTQGDLLIHAPEFDTVGNQFCTTDTLDSRYFAMIESNYDLLTYLDLKDFTNVFESLSEYLTTRSVMGGRSYDISSSHYDDEGNYYEEPTYNVYGDYVLERPNGPADVMLKNYKADYTRGPFTEPVIDAINQVYHDFDEAGVEVYFTYAPRNQSAISLESTMEERALLHKYLVARLDVPVISDIESYIYSGIYFYEIDNHLSDQGVQMRTEQVIKDLRPWIGP